MLFGLLRVPVNSIYRCAIGCLNRNTVPLVVVALKLSVSFSTLTEDGTVVMFASVVGLTFFPLITFILTAGLNLISLRCGISVVRTTVPSKVVSLLLTVACGLSCRLASSYVLVGAMVSLVALPVVVSVL